MTREHMDVNSPEMAISREDLKRHLDDYRRFAFAGSTIL